MPPVDATAAPPTGSVVAEPWTSFAAWAADTLGLRLDFDGAAYWLTESGYEPAPEPGQKQSGRSWLGRRRPREDTSDPAPEAFQADNAAAVLHELVRRLGDLEQPPAAKPQVQPEAVHEITRPLFEAYTLEGGAVHVAGCRLEDRPLVRLSRIADDSDPLTVRHAYFDASGVCLGVAAVEDFGAERVTPLPATASRSEHRTPEAAISAARATAETLGIAGEALATIVWVKHAAGVLRFEFGEESLDTPFEGWAKTLQAPPAECPATGKPTFHLATVEDGSIVAADEIGVCSVTGHRHPIANLVRSTASGKLAEPQFTTACSVTGDAALESELVTCPRSGERVVPAAMSKGICDALAVTGGVAANDQRLTEALTKHPELASRRWTVADTPSVFVLESAGWLRTRVVTIDRETLAIKHRAEAARFSGVWRPVKP